jgi:CHAT domain-containing protein
MSPATLPANKQRLIYAVFPSRLQIWFDNGTRIESRSITIKKPELEKLAQQFSRACSVPESTEPFRTDRIGEQLFGALIAPVQKWLSGNETLAIEADDPLAGIAFEALKSPEGWYLDDKYTVSYSPGRSAEEKLHVPAKLGPGDRFLLLDASAASGPGYLPGHSALIKAVQQLPVSASVVPTRSSAPQAIARQLQLARALVFFGHGRPFGSGAALELSDGVLLTPRDLVPENTANLNLAFLAACSTGASQGGLLDSRSLVRTFVNGGVPATIASRWNVDSETTASLVSKFLTLYPGENTADALRSARLYTRKLHPHPYYWAAFGITGRTDPAR